MAIIGHDVTHMALSHFAIENAKARERVLSYLNHPDRQSGFYVLHNRKVVGIVSAAVGPHYLSCDGLIATCLSFSVDPDQRRSMLGGRVSALLLKTIQRWARAQGASMLTIHGTSGYVGRMMNGARMVGANVMCDIQIN